MRKMTTGDWTSISWFGPDDVPDWQQLDYDLIFGVNEMATRLQSRPVWISTWRSPEKQQSLIDQGLTTATKSFHLTGQAGDLTFPGISLDKVYNAAVQARFKGIGLYPETDSIHVDTRTEPGTWSRIKGKYLALTAAWDWLKKKRGSA